MDKTFNDLMDIVNRTKKIDESEGKVSRPRTKLFHTKNHCLMAKMLSTNF